MGRKKGALLSDKDFKALKTKRGKQFVGVFLLISSFCGFISIIANSGNGVDYTNTIIFLLVLTGIGLYLVLSTFAFFKGWIGEKRVGFKLKALARRYAGFVINDVTIPDEETSRTSQIDHIFLLDMEFLLLRQKTIPGISTETIPNLNGHKF